MKDGSSYALAGVVTGILVVGVLFWFDPLHLHATAQGPAERPLPPAPPGPYIFDGERIVGIAAVSPSRIFIALERRVLQCETNGQTWDWQCHPLPGL